METNILPIVPIRNYISCLYKYFLINFINEGFIVKVTIKETSFQLKPSKRLVATMLNHEKFFILDPRQYITSPFEKDKVSI